MISISEWVTESDISSRLGHKILIAGLSEAGKTAVKRIFFLKQSTDDVNSLSATINYERLAVTVKDTPITIVDLGGQKVFLKRFLSAFSPFVFSNVRIFIFLIDVSNRSTQNNSLQYFTACIEKLNNFSPEAEVFVFLHKNDLVISSPNYESIHEQLKERFQLEFKSPLRFFRTTIYRPETVIDAFGRIFELNIPDLAESDFVDGRQIGKIEEFHETAMTLRDPKAKVITTKTEKPLIQITAPKMAGDPEVLQRLQSLMKQATQTGGVKTANAKATSIPSTKPIFEEAKVTPTAPKVVAEASKPLDKVKTEISTPAEVEGILEDLAASEILSKPETVEVQEPSPPSEEAFVEQIVYLVEFCGIEPDIATEVVKAGYGELFKIAASSGVPVSTLTDVFLEYIPFVISSQGEKKAAALTGQRLLDIFSAYLKDRLDEESIVKCLVFAVERPKMPIDEIIQKYLAEAIKKKREESRKAIKETGIPVYDGPLYDDSAEGIVLLPGTQDLGYSLNPVDDSRNMKITIFLRNPQGKYSPIGSSTISININTDEILYLLAYELNLINLSYYDGGISSMAASAHIIHKDIHQAVNENKFVDDTKTAIAKTPFEPLLDHIIPLEVKTDGEFVILPDTDKIGINIVKSKKQGVLINFVQRGYPIGRVNVIETITAAQLSGLLTKAMQLPIESPGAIDFAAKMIKLIITDLMKSKEEKYPYPTLKRPRESDIEVDVTSTEKEEEGSDKLMFYLSLLEKDKE